MTPPHGVEDSLVQEMFAQMMKEGHSARRVGPGGQALSVRRGLRKRGRTNGVRLRTAHVDDVVLVARLDAAIWLDDPQTMRRKLAPPY